METRLHRNATTTPAIREAIQQSNASHRALAQKYGVSLDTIRRWRQRDTVSDRSHTAHRLQTTLNDGQEELVVYLRQRLLLPLDDLLVVVREFIEPTMSRAALSRLLRRRNCSRLPAAEPDKRPIRQFRDYAPGYLHIDVKYLPKMQDEDQRRYAFVAIDRASRWVFIGIYQYKTAASARAFLKALHKAVPFRIKTILTDNGKEFTDRLFASRERQPSGQHEFDQLCRSLGIEHRLTRPRTPQTNGMVERFNGRIALILRTHHFNGREHLEEALMRYAWLYNQHVPQKGLGHRTPIQALKEWQTRKPDLFIKSVRNRPVPNT